MHGKAGGDRAVVRRFGAYALRVSIVCAIAAIATAALFSVGVAKLVSGQKVEKLLFEAEQVVSLVNQATFGGEVSGAIQALGFTHKRIKGLVEGTLSPDDPITLRDLSLIRDRYKTSLVYVLDADGTVVACTPYGENLTLTGNNYGFRPYFQQALQGNNLVYAAVGVTTGKRGLYFASPVYLSGQEKPGQIGGVVVAKMGLSTVDRVLASWPSPLAVVSPSGIVFASNRWEWVRRNGTQPGGQQAERILKSRQFGEHKATELYALNVGTTGPRVTLPEGTYLSARRPLALQDALGSWRLVLFHPAPDVQIAGIALAGCVIIAWIYVAMGLHLVSRRHRRRLEMEKERAGREAEETYKSIFDSANDVIFVHELGTGRIVDANKQCLDKYGYSPDEIKYLGVRQISSGEPPHSEVEAARWIEAAEREGPQVFEWEAKKKSGEFFWVEVSLRRGDIGGIPRILAVVRDISERKKVELELKRLNTRLTQSTHRAQELAYRAEMANQAKSDFLARVSHEIRTPMNGVLGMTELLQATELNPRQRELANTARHSAESLLAVINDILDFSKIEAGRLELDDVDFDLWDVIEGTAEMLAEKAQRKGLELAVWISPAVPRWLRGDPLRLRQILTNLLGNAVKFTEHGDVVVRVKEFGATAHSVLLHVEVQDTGIGIAREAQERVFDSFAQADGSSVRRYGGTGLGLSIARQLAGLLQGEIRLASTPGQGSTFWFTARFARQADRQPEPDTGSVDLQGMRTLVVDDNSASGGILRDYLAAWKTDVVLVDSGAQALETLAQAGAGDNPFELVLADLDMPGMDGKALVQAMRQREELSRIRVVLLQPVAAEGGGGTREADLVVSVTKPVRQQQLLEAITGGQADGRACDESGAARQATGGTERPLNLKVLLAEDNPVNQLVAQEMLTLLGCEVYLVEDGGEALAALKTETFDLVLMDGDMPVMDGYEVTRRIRQHERDSGAPRVPILALTASAMMGDRERALQAGMDDYLSKPIEQAVLCEALHRWTPSQTPDNRSSGVI